ncbi:MAG: M28 family peptidase [Planctomycetota bacterium]
MRVRLALLCLAAALAVPSACKKPPAPPPPATREQAFDEGRSWKDLQALCAMGPRCHGSEGHKKAQAYLRDTLKACGAEVRDLPFEYRGREDGTPRPFTNIAGRFKGKQDEQAGLARKWVLLGTHYDTRLWGDVDHDEAARGKPIEGANDGGSGTAVLLEVVRVLQAHPPDVGVEIVFFDGEDYGRPSSPDYFLGSKDMARNWDKLYPGPRPACAVILDMVGDADFRLWRDGVCERAHPWLNELLWKAGSELGSPAFVGSPLKGVTDDQTALMEIGIPATLLIDFDYPPWHTSRDTIDRCSAKSLGITGRALLRALIDRPFETK